MADAETFEEIAKWNHWFAVECNNRAWSLADMPARSAEEDAEMLHSAHAAALHWSAVGTELNHARAAMLLGHVYALLGDRTRGLEYARTAFDYVMSHESPAWEIAMAHAVLANGASAAGDRALHTAHHMQATALAAALEDPEDRSIVEATLRTFPRPDVEAP